jgi:large subunit ribosomal protein L11
MGDIKVMVNGGKANAGPPLGPALAPTGINIGEVVAKINEKTASFDGMQVPVTVSIKGKEFEISVGLPPTSALIKKEVNAAKGAANPKEEVVGNLTIEQIKKIAEQKMDALNAKDEKKAVREVMGVCNSMGVSVEGKRAKETLADMDEGKFSDKF